MHTFKMKRPFQLLAGGALLVLANAALAQYMWIDAKGTKQFSDQPPPPSVPASKILKSPPRQPIAVDEADAPPQKAAAAAPGAPSLAEREADFRKRQKDKADADKKAAATAANQAQRQAACNAARARNAELASGKRLRASAADRTMLDDNARAAAQASTNQALAECNQ